MPHYTTDILHVLAQVPEGLPIRAIVKYVYNRHNTLFANEDIDIVKRRVTNYLVACSRSRKSPIVHGEQRGVYKLRQIMEREGEFEFEITDNG